MLCWEEVQHEVEFISICHLFVFPRTIILLDAFCFCMDEGTMNWDQMIRRMLPSSMIVVGLRTLRHLAAPPVSTFHMMMIDEISLLYHPNLWLLNKFVDIPPSLPSTYISFLISLNVWMSFLITNVSWRHVLETSQAFRLSKQLRLTTSWSILFTDGHLRMVLQVSRKEVEKNVNFG